MPLLHRKPFTSKPFPKELKDSEEVFFCHMTKEVFKDYDEFCDRVILCNSLVWSCSLTGRSHLTYQEAAASEEKVKRLLKTFPMELRIPVLYLASICERKSLVELAEEVFSYVKDRFFIGETVQVNLSHGAVTCHILAVVPPSTQELEALSSKVVQNSEERHYPPAVAYKYEVERHDNNEEITVAATDIHRKKTSYNKDKNRLYIKQFVHLDGGVWRLKESSNIKYGINKVKFSHIFCGEPPDMNPKKSPAKRKNSGDKMGSKKQETINKYFKTAEKKLGVNPRKSPKKAAELSNGDLKKAKKRRMTKKEMEETKLKNNQLNREREKSAKMEKRLQYMEFLKEWNMKREDLECEDLKTMPTPVPVQCQLPNECFGDIAMMMEFLHSFTSILRVKDFFPHGITFELLERCFMGKEVAGPLSDFIQLLIIAIFELQEQEDSEIKDTDIRINSGLNFVRGDYLSRKITALATRTESWVRKHHSLPLPQLILDTSTLSEVLRLHLLQSGSMPCRSKVAKWRYQQRGGYFNDDDPAIVLKREHPEIIDKLGSTSIIDFDSMDKIRIVNCLINQILTYSSVRDLIDTSCENAKQYRVELRALKAEQARKDKVEATRLKELKKDNKAPVIAKKTENESATPDAENRELRSGVVGNQKKAIETLREEIRDALANTQLAPLGVDRAFRRYWVFRSLPGLYVEDNDTDVGPCLVKSTPVGLFDPDNAEDSIAYVRRLFEENGNKENNSCSKHQNILSSNSPSKKLLAEKNSDCSPSAIKNSKPKTDSVSQPFVCTADVSTCPIHGLHRSRPIWSYFRDEMELDKLIDSLNMRGIREKKLQQNLNEQKSVIASNMKQCPFGVDQKSSSFDPNGDKSLKAFKVMRPYENANLGYPETCSVEEIVENTLRDLILETEEKINGGALGTLKVKDRDLWRKAISEKGYDKQCKKLVWGTAFLLSEEDNLDNSPSSMAQLNGEDLEMEVDDIKKEDSESRCSSPSLEINDPEPESTGIGFEIIPQKQVMLDLASAILQIEQSIEHKYLKRPLGLDQKERDRSDLRMPTPAMERWEKALMESTSYSQLFLFFSTLDNSVLWERSALNAFCRICRRRTDPENMLLCDTCNKGHHLYCLKPKLTKVPAGDWHCRWCKPKERISPVKKRRRLFSDEEDEIDDLCTRCNETGAELNCESCDAQLHLTCVNPPVRKVPKSKWFCHDCRLSNSMATPNATKKDSEELVETSVAEVKSEETKNSVPTPKVKKEPTKRSLPNPYEYEYVDDWGSSDRLSPDTERLSRRKSSKAATAKISQFAKQLRSTHWDENGVVDDQTKESSRSRRSRRSVETVKKARFLPLDNAALQEILETLMHHKDAWPFLRPVTKSEVPDYHLIIKKPMDFATIKHKLNMLEYTKNSELIADANLLFSNCSTYNQEGSEVYKAGETLEKLFYKLIKEYNLQINGEVSENDYEPQ